MKRRGERRARWKSKNKGPSNVNLISMMDILTVLLLFLLKSYVAGGEVMVPAPGIHLPASTADVPPPTSVVVAIDKNEIVVGSDPVVSIADAMSGDELVIAPLGAHLQTIQKQQDDIARLRGAEAPTELTATIQGDKDIQFRVLQRVMYTLGQNGYGNIALAVIQKS